MSAYYRNMSALSRGQAAYDSLQSSDYWEDWDNEVIDDDDPKIIDEEEDDE